MMEYRSDTGGVVELQRRDANDALKNLNVKQFKVKKIWIYLMALVFGVAIFAASIALLPSDEIVDGKGEPDVAFAISQKQIAQLTELIEAVKSSDMESPYKESIAENLEQLLFDLKTVTLHKEMMDRVQESVKYIEKTVDDSECIDELYEALTSHGDSITNIVAEYLKAKEWAGYSEISLKLSDSFKYSGGAASDDTMRDDVKKKLENTAAYISLSLAFSGVEENEPLYIVLSRIVNAEENNEVINESVYGFARIADKLSENTYEWSKTKISTLLTVIEPELYTAMEPEKTNVKVGEDAADELCRIFGITRTDKDDDSKEDDKADNVKPDDEKGDGASAGDGHVYPTDDKVYDIGSDENVPYGNLWAMYNDKINNLDDEEKKAIYQKYFSILYNGFEENSDAD